MEKKERRTLWKKIRNLEDDKDKKIEDLEQKITSLQEQLEKVEVIK